MGNHPASLSFVPSACSLRRWLLAPVLFVISASGALAQSTPPGVQIRNVARIDYQLGTRAVTVESSAVTVAVQAAPSRSSIEILRFAGGATANTAGPSACLSGAAFVPLPAPQVAGQGAIDPLAGVPLADAPVVHAGDAVFLRVTDQDRNLDGTVLDTVELRVSARSTTDTERLRLTETGPNTGVFTGYVPSRLAAGPAANCALDIERDSLIDADYVDPQDATDVSRDSSLIDPSGVIFDSTNGDRVDGVRVRLIDAATGQLAVVFGDDGISRFPAEIITGLAATDSGGTSYRFAPGAFRFPLVAPGSYRLVVEVPVGYAAPSLAAPASLAGLAGGPYRIQPGSFSAPFVVAAPPGAALDIPIDPVASALSLSKTTPATVAALGDVIEYQLRLTNEDARLNARDIVLDDQLPVGLRLRADSVRIDGVRGADPVQSPDGRGLRFAVALLGPGRVLTIRYVADVVPGATGRELINTAQARATGGTESNLASARVALREDFYRERGFVLGRVLKGSCDEPESGLSGVAGIRVYLETGRYAVSDAGGRYHFEDLAPGTHVVQIDTATVPEGMELLRCAPSVRDGGRAYSRFVELHGGELEQVDFRLRELPPPVGSLALQLESRLLDDGQIAHRVRVTASTVGLQNVRVMLQLPDSFALVDPARVARSGVWTEDIGSLGPGKEREFTILTRRVGPDQVQPEMRALALFDLPGKPGQRTAPVATRFEPVAPPPPPARLSSARLTLTPQFSVLGTDLAMADSASLSAFARRYRDARIARVTVAGHADSTPISARSRRLFGDNLALSRARAEAVARWLQQAFDLPDDVIQIEAYGDQRPLSAGRDAASLARNRRVELELQYEIVDRSAPPPPPPPAPIAAEPPRWTDQNQTDTVGSWQRSPATGASNATAPAAQPSGVQASGAQASAEPAFDVEKLAPQFVWLFPGTEAIPAIPSTKVALSHPYGTRVELSINGWPVSQLNFDGVVTSKGNRTHLSRWRGIDLRDGDNLLVARLIDPSDTVVATLERHIHFAGSAVRAEIAKNESRLLADGRQRPEIVLRLFDAYGQPARPGTRGLFKIDAPYRSWWEVQQLDVNPLLTAGVQEPQFEVGPDGLARIELEPTTQAGFAVLHLRFNERRDQELRVWLSPAARDFVMVAVASGTVAHQTLSRNIESSPALLAELAREGVEEGDNRDGRVSFFAKGRIRGDFLLTLAYDSARDRDAARERLKGIVEPDRYYLLYGDGAEPRDEAASGENLYIKLERAQFVALFGDYDTGFTVTELARYNRSLTGLKTDFAGDKLTLSAFAARTDLGQVRDQLAADGTSGSYRLSRAPIVVGSDKVRLETRDRFNPERLISVREQSRFLDYRIDYDTGELRFREPIESRDRDFNPVTIVAEYETPGQGVETTSAGARVSWRAAESAELAATAVQDGSLNGDTRLVAVDAKWQLGAATELRAEVARSESEDPLKASQATAWLTELRHVDEVLEVRAYARSEEAGFGLGQQFAGLGGSRKYGADARWQWRERWNLHAQAFRQDSLESDAQRLLAQAELRYQSNDMTFGVGLEHADDRAPDGVQRRSDNATLAASREFFDRKVTVRATAAAALGNNDDSIDYPARSVLGVDYHLPRATTLFAEWEHGSGSSIDTDMTRIGLRSQPFDRTQLTSSVTQERTEYGPRVASNLGLSQGWQLSEAWSIEGGIEQSNTLRGPAFVPQDPTLPLVAGTVADDFLATFAGAQYHREDWTLAARIERRAADLEDRWVGTAGWYRAERGGHALSLVAQFEQRDALTLEDTEQTDVRFAWAYRPDQGRWIVLNRLDLRRDARSGGLSEYETLKFVDNLHANWQWNSKTQLGLQLGLKEAVSTLDGDRFSSRSALLGLDVRRDLTARFDLGLHVSTLRNITAGSGMNQFGLDVGFAPARNVWLSLGYNFRGFEDSDFAAARAHHAGPNLQLRFKLDQDTFKDLSLDALRAPSMSSAP